MTTEPFNQCYLKSTDNVCYSKFQNILTNKARFVAFLVG